jgi:multifunctional beta-oxidation protein
MSQIEYEGQVAIVTGAGAGLGRLYALMLAARNAKVVVNDMNPESAATVVEEIKAAGGEATADTHSVVEGDAVVGTAVEAYGAVHIIVNNAGILRDTSFQRMKPEEFDIVVQVHLYGTFSMCRAAWPIMREQEYGRIVNITSVNGLYGQFGQANYSAAKSGIVGLSKTLAQEGAKRNIKCNVVAPGAGTAMTATVMPEHLVAAWLPDYVAPMIAVLASEQVPCSGSIFEAAGGWFGQVKWMRTQGAFFDIADWENKPFTPEDVLGRFSEITDWTDAVFPDDVKVCTLHYLPSIAWSRRWSWLLSCSDSRPWAAVSPQASGEIEPQMQQVLATLQKPKL